MPEKQLRGVFRDEFKQAIQVLARPFKISCRDQERVLEIIQGLVRSADQGAPFFQKDIGVLHGLPEVLKGRPDGVLLILDNALHLGDRVFPCRHDVNRLFESDIEGSGRGFDGGNDRGPLAVVEKASGT